MTNSALHVASEEKGFWTRSRVAFTFGVLALVAAFMLPACQSDAVSSKPSAAPAVSNQPPAPTKPAASAPRPPLPATVLNAELKDLDGKTFKLSDYAGKVVIVNIWATWCGPCRKEIPDLIKVSEDYKSRGLEVIGMTNEDPVEDEAVVKDFVAAQNIPYRIAWGDQGFAVGLSQGNVRNVVPQSFVITGDGRVVAHLVGFNQETTPQRLRQAIEQALNSKG